jgi:hypothetical protein
MAPSFSDWLIISRSFDLIKSIPETYTGVMG